jgi:hypothetical protein
MAAELGSLDSAALTFGLVGGSTNGFVFWLAAFELLPRLHELAGI